MFATTEKNNVAVVSAMEELTSIAIARADADKKTAAIGTNYGRFGKDRTRSPTLPGDHTSAISIASVPQSDPSRSSRWCESDCQPDIDVGDEGDEGTCDRQGPRPDHHQLENFLRYRIGDGGSFSPRKIGSATTGNIVLEANLIIAKPSALNRAVTSTGRV